MEHFVLLNVFYRFSKESPKYLKLFAELSLEKATRRRHFPTATHINKYTYVFVYNIYRKEEKACRN